MIYYFTASRISDEGNAVFPDEIIIDDQSVTYRKKKVIGSKETKVNFDAIGSVSVERHILFADIVIETRGGLRICAKGFSKSDAEKISRLLNRY